MPFDSIATGVRPEAAATSSRPVAVWLFVICAMLMVMITLGGATRLTGSGLSIMEWAPIMGTLPPLSDAEWQRLFTLYKGIPQYALVNEGFGLEGFKRIFWLEWGHRFWGRMIGLAFLLPLIWFAVRGAITARLARRLALLFVLGGLQGAIGWFMVASGFTAESTTVNPYRLVVHLSMALVLYSAILWTALSLWRTEVAPNDIPVLRWATVATCSLVGLTILAGGFVAGLRAGLSYNSFPLMDGRLVPEGYTQLQPFVRNLTENIAAVQFNHRVLATTAVLVALATVAIGLARASGTLRLALVALGAGVLGQYALGVATLLWVVPVGLGTAHQGMAVLVLTAALVALHLQAGPRRIRAAVTR
ncbi:MAG: COX15/CtaA family protein [Gemmatimonadaceae bacterium]|nr:COX15/CtaA family protein [Acetobacteraceae bacterium]